MSDEARDTPLLIRPARANEAKRLGRMMVAGLDSRLNNLGPWFVSYLLRHMIVSRHTVFLSAEREGDLVGFGVALVDRAAFYREFVIRKGVVATLLTLPWLVRPTNIRTALSALLYGGKSADDDPKAEFVSMVVSPHARRTGVALAITNRIMADVHARGVDFMKVTTPPDNHAANKLYERYGFRLLRTDKLYHDSLINVYEMPLGPRD